MAVGQLAGLTAWKLPAATPPEAGAAAWVALVDEEVVVVASSFSVVEAGGGATLATPAGVDDAGSPLLELFFLHDLRPRDARGTAGACWGPRGLS